MERQIQTQETCQHADDKSYYKHQRIIFCQHNGRDSRYDQVRKNRDHAIDLDRENYSQPDGNIEKEIPDIKDPDEMVFPVFERFGEPEKLFEKNDLYQGDSPKNDPYHLDHIPAYRQNITEQYFLYIRITMWRF